MKEITLTPEVLSAFVEKDTPSTVTVSNHGFNFNKSAAIKLALKPKQQFLIAFYDGKIFYSDVPSGGFNIGSPIGKAGLLSASASKVKMFFEKQLNLKAKNFKFEIGEFKEGRRELISVK